MDHCSVFIKGKGLFHSGFWLLAIDYFLRSLPAKPSNSDLALRTRFSMLNIKAGYICKPA